VFLADCHQASRAKAHSFPVCSPDAQIGPVAHPEAPATVAKLVDQGAISWPHPTATTNSSRPGAWACAPGQAATNCGAEALSVARASDLGPGGLSKVPQAPGESGQPLVRSSSAEHFYATGFDFGASLAEIGLGQTSARITSSWTRPWAAQRPIGIKAVACPAETIHRQVDQGNWPGPHPPAEHVTETAPVPSLAKGSRVKGWAKMPRRLKQRTPARPRFAASSKCGIGGRHERCPMATEGEVVAAQDTKDHRALAAIKPAREPGAAAATPPPRNRHQVGDAKGLTVGPATRLARPSGSPRRAASQPWTSSRLSARFSTRGRSPWHCLRPMGRWRSVAAEALCG